MIGSCIAFNPCYKCDEKAKCSICELTYYRNGYIKSPTADVVEVRHGEWIVITEERDTMCGKVKLQHKECSVCGYPMGLCGCLYCGNCGAKMDGERSENGETI